MMEGVGVFFRATYSSLSFLSSIWGNFCRMINVKTGEIDPTTKKPNNDSYDPHGNQVSAFLQGEGRDRSKFVKSCLFLAGKMWARCGLQVHPGGGAAWRQVHPRRKRAVALSIYPMDIQGGDYLVDMFNTAPGGDGWKRYYASRQHKG